MNAKKLVMGLELGVAKNQTLRLGLGIPHAYSYEGTYIALDLGVA